MSTNTNIIDKCTVEFISLNGSDPITIGNWTYYDIGRDYFTPADAFSFVLEDDRADQLNAELQVGMQCNININNNLIMIGFIDSFEYSYSRQTGKRLTLRGRDLLGVIADSTIFPNLGTGGTTDFQFTPNTTLDTIFNTIFAPFGAIMQIDDTDNLTLATAFGFGRKSSITKTPKGLARSLKTKLGHLKKPNKGEKFLSYAQRFADLLGAHIKMAPGSKDTIIVNSPIYDRTTPPPFRIQHLTKNDPTNNAESGAMHVSYKEQASVLILEGTTGSATFKKQNFKVVAINEITGYSADQTVLPIVNQAIKQLTTGIASNSSNGTGYYQIPAKIDLFAAMPSSVIGLQTAFNRPDYQIDESGKTASELAFTCAKKMASMQQKYFFLEYKMTGHTQLVDGQPVVWYPNIMCNVIDDTFDPKNSLNSNYWIEKVSFHRSRGAGTYTMVKLNLPYIYAFDISYPDIQNKAATIKAKHDINVEQQAVILNSEREKPATSNEVSGGR